MFKAIFKTIAVVFTTLGVLIQELCGLFTDVVLVSRDLTGASKAVSGSFKQRIEMFEEQKSNAIAAYKKVQDDADTTPEQLDEAYQTAMNKIKAINLMIKELEEAEDQA